MLQKQQTAERQKPAAMRWAHLVARMCLQLETRLRATLVESSLTVIDGVASPAHWGSAQQAKQSMRCARAVAAQRAAAVPRLVLLQTKQQCACLETGLTQQAKTSRQWERQTEPPPKPTVWLGAEPT